MVLLRCKSKDVSVCTCFDLGPKSFELGLCNAMEEVNICFKIIFFSLVQTNS